MHIHTKSIQLKPAPVPQKESMGTRDQAAKLEFCFPFPAALRMGRNCKIHLQQGCSVLGSRLLPSYLTEYPEWEGTLRAHPSAALALHSTAPRASSSAGRQELVPDCPGSFRDVCGWICGLQAGGSGSCPQLPLSCHQCVFVPSGGGDGAVEVCLVRYDQTEKGKFR